MTFSPDCPCASELTTIMILQDEVNSLWKQIPQWVSVKEGLPESKPSSYGKYKTDTVLVIHSDKPDYPITAHAYLMDSDFMEYGMAIPTNGVSDKPFIKWCCIPANDKLNNPFNLKDKNYDEYASKIFGEKITHWAYIPKLLETE